MPNGIKDCTKDEAPSQQQVDLNGFITIENNPISRAGVFPYLGKSISPECIPDKVYNVYRPAEELEKPEALESFKLIPFVDEHTMIGSEEKKLLAPESKGVQGSTGENVSFKDGVLYATIKIFGQTISSMIKMGKRDLSLGYWCKFIKQSGVFNGKAYDYIQTNLRGNHLALVETGRCDVAVLDQQMAFDHFDLALDNEELNNMANEKESKAEGEQEAKDKAKDAEEKKEESAKEEGEETKKEMSLDDVHAFMKDAMPKLAKIQDLLDKHTGKKDEEGEEKADPAADDADFKPTTSPKTGTGKGVTDEDEKKEKGAMDEAIKTLNAKVETLHRDGFKAIMKEAASRDTLANQLSQFIGTFDHAEMTQSEVAEYGVKKLGINCAKGQELNVLTGYLHDRKPSTIGFGLDSAIEGKKGKYAEHKAKLA